MRRMPSTEVTCWTKDPNSDDEEDETAELLRELEKIKRERAEQKEKEASLEDDPIDYVISAKLFLPGAREDSSRAREARE